MLDGLPEPKPKDSRTSWCPSHTIPAKGVLGKVQRSSSNSTHPTGVLSFTGVNIREKLIAAPRTL